MSDELVRYDEVEKIRAKVYEMMSGEEGRAASGMVHLLAALTDRTPAECVEIVVGTYLPDDADENFLVGLLWGLSYATAVVGFTASMDTPNQEMKARATRAIIQLSALASPAYERLGVIGIEKGIIQAISVIMGGNESTDPDEFSDEDWTIEDKSGTRIAPEKSDGNQE